LLFYTYVCTLYLYHTEKSVLKLLMSCCFIIYREYKVRSSQL